MRRIPVVLAMLWALVGGPAVASADPLSWPVAGHDLGNTRSTPAAGDLRPGAVPRLTTAWSVVTQGTVTVTPAVASGTVYFPDSSGRLQAVNAESGAVLWSHPVSDATGVAGDLSRDTPAVAGGELIFGDSSFTGTGARVAAVDRGTGRALWSTQVDTGRAAIVTSSPVVYRGVAYVGVSSYEEGLIGTPGFTCCDFRGSVVALDARTGRLLWKTHTVPDGYSGGAVWGSSPAVDPRLGLLYVGTGNNYSVPSGVCSSPDETGCTPPSADDHDDSVLALSLTTGAIQWSRATLPSDVVSCGTPQQCGPDFDFGSDPNLYRLPSGRELLGIGQKSGVYRALDPRTGALVWQTTVGPGSSLGGIEWGSAVDGSRIYTAIGNINGQPYQITGADGRTSTVAAGSWAALDAATGRILWQVADPQSASDFGYVTSAGGVVYAGSSAASGDTMYALDARTGRKLWSFAAGGPVVGGAAVVAGSVYWGSGYTAATRCPGGTGPVQLCRSGTGPQALYAFRLPR